MSKLITVFGSPGSGKTLLSLALAGILARRKENVILLSTDKLTPHLRVLLPTVDTDRTSSIGSLLMQSELTQKLVTTKLVFHPNSNYMGCMAFAPGDSLIAYPPLFDPAKILSLLNILSGIADYVIVDGSSNPVTDSITLAALEAGERILCMLTPDTKGMEYLDAVLPVLRDEKYKTAKHLRVLSPVQEISPVQEVRGRVEDIRFTLPYSAEAHEAMLTGKLIGGFNRRAGLVYESRVHQILEAIM